MSDLIERLTDWAATQPDKVLYGFLDSEGKERDTYTYATFEERTRQVAGHLLAAKLRRGDRALLVYPPGLEVIVAFFACARIGVIAVPVYPPTPMNFESGLAKLAFVARDCDARAALTTRGFYRSYRLLLAKRRVSSLWRRSPALPEIAWVTTDDAVDAAPERFVDDPDPVLFLQYTSGSTSDPKGVVVTHGNVLHNCAGTLDHSPTCVSWLPQYHDMGLIGYYLYPLVTGGTTYGFSPLDFLKNPVLWLQTISRVRATYASSPNFGFEYCLREDKVPDEAIAGIDLSSLRVLMNAAEPVRAETFQRFYQRFSSYGLRPEAHIAAYGLAESTLAVSQHGKKILTVNKKLLQQRVLHLENGLPRNNNQLRLVSCGKPLDGVHVRIVDPETRAILGENRVGEIWISGPSVCAGYWNRADLSEEVFGARLADGVAGGDPHLRTGDLGFFHEGEVFVCGRIKDLIIIRGVNYYPQDIESIVEASSDKVRSGSVVAFDVDEEGEALVVVAEVKNPADLPDPGEIARAIRTQYYVEPRTLVFVPRKAIPKTTSGKLARRLTRQRWLDGELPVIVVHNAARGAERTGDLSVLRERFQYIVELYNLTGREECTFAEIGIDSLTMVELVGDIKELLEEHGAGELVHHVDLRLLQRLTIAEFFSMIDRFEGNAAEPISALRDLLRSIQAEHETYERECMRADAQLETAIAPGDGGSRPAVSHVLLTGSTGFFGPFLLDSLLRRTPYTYHVLTRAADPVHGRDRIRASLRRSRLWTPALQDAFESRVHAVPGDLTRPNLGLRPETWRALAAQTQAIVHNGAMVNYVLSYDALKPHNVDGTREVLRFAASGAPKAFHYVSSTFIYGWTVKPTLLETDNNDDMANLDFGYAQSKWVAEQLVLAAARNGLPVRIYRPSLLSASTSGVGSRDDIATRLLAFMIKYGVGVKAKNQISFLPADIAADNIASILNQDDARQTTYHVTVDEYYNMMDVTRRITAKYGYPFRYFEIPEFVEEMNRRCTKDDLLYPLIDFFNRSHPKIAAMQHKRYNNDGYRAARDRTGEGRPDPPLDLTVSLLVDYLLREGTIPDSPTARAADFPPSA